MTSGGDDKVTSDPLKYHLPAIYSQVGGYADDGGLLAYSPDFVASQRRAATYVSLSTSLLLQATRVIQ